MWFNVDYYHNTHSTQQRCTHYTPLLTGRYFQSVCSGVSLWCVILPTNSSPLAHLVVNIPLTPHHSSQPTQVLSPGLRTVLVCTLDFCKLATACFDNRTSKDLTTALHSSDRAGASYVTRRRNQGSSNRDATIRSVLIDWLITTEWDYVYALLSLADILFIPQIWVCRATVEWQDLYWQGKTEELGEKPFPMPLCPPQIPHALTRARTRAFEARLATNRVIHGTAHEVCVKWNPSHHGQQGVVVYHVRWHECQQFTILEGTEAATEGTETKLHVLLNTPGAVGL
jgi:hypothetical protein